MEQNDIFVQFKSKFLKPKAKLKQVSESCPEMSMFSICLEIHRCTKYHSTVGEFAEICRFSCYDYLKNHKLKVKLIKSS